MTRSQAYDRHPEHRVELCPEPRRMRAVLGGRNVDAVWRSMPTA